MFKYKLSCKNFIKHYFFPRQSVSAFTLVELLIVVGILAVLSTTAVVFLNPLGQLQQARDSNRLTGLESVRQTLSLLNLGNSPPSFGSSNVIYVSLPDDTSPNCASWNLPAPPTGWSYACQNEANFKKVNGSGWLPIDLTSTTFSTTSAVLPTDPQNNTTNYYYYVYDSTTGAYELGAVLEADKNQTLAINDGGDNPGFWELGSRLSLYPTTGSLAVNNESNQPVSNESSLLAYAQAALTGQVAYFIGTNQITGSNDFFWNDSTKKLTVAGTIESTGFKLTTTPTAGYVLTSDTSGVGTWQAAAGGSQWITSGSNIYFNTGNVGIGTTGPGTKLDILGGLTSETDGSQRIRLRGYSAGLEIVDKDNVENFYIAIDDDDSNNLKIGPGYGPGQGLGTYLTIKSSGVAGAGNVGIGTTGPSYKLDVSGQINTSGGLC
ncbi:MAG TPA: type II secretion system protein, partial [Candidatus Paceibacterota bacterium]|nr:type II secretion system protein [Candidatus Paceibacterota bacterium]